MDIPSSVIAVKHTWGRHQGIEQPGALCCVCYPTNIAYIVTRQVIRYDATLLECPTRDNVRVDVDIFLTFKVCEDEESVKNFIYKLGACRLEDMLSSELEEAVRNFVREIDHRQVLDVKSEMAGNMIKELNLKFKRFGVKFENASISSIRLPYKFQ